MTSRGLLPMTRNRNARLNQSSGNRFATPSARMDEPKPAMLATIYLILPTTLTGSGDISIDCVTPLRHNNVMPFVKLDTGILDSSLWSEPAQTCKCWITLLAMADAEGFVRSTAPGIARRANLGLTDTEAALAIFESPDSHSRTLDEEGKRIKRIDGGYQIVNYEKYRERDYTAAERQKRWREKKKSNAVTPVTRNVISHRVTHAEADAEADKKKEGANGSRPQSVEDWLKELEADKTYQGIDVRREYGKMLNWCKLRSKKPTQRRFVNWLNNAEKTLPSQHAARPDYKRNYLPPARELSDEEFESQRKIALEETKRAKEAIRNV